MAIQIGAKPDSGFDDPIGMLVDCHRRIEKFLGILGIVVDRARGRALSDEEIEAVQAALNYFRLGGQRHNADEEESLFPRMRSECTAEESKELNALEGDHRRANELHGAVEALYTEWITRGRLNEADERRLSSSTLELRRLYEEHIQLEEQTVFPRAAAALSGEAIAAIGREFQARRR
jgi:hemerythrin-like domain-containing protein